MMVTKIDIRGTDYIALGPTVRCCYTVFSQMLQAVKKVVHCSMNLVECKQYLWSARCRQLCTALGPKALLARAIKK